MLRLFYFKSTESIGEPPLEIPQNPRDSHFSHSPDCCWYLKQHREI